MVMVEGAAWTKHLQQIAKWAVLGAVGLVVGLLALYCFLNALGVIYVLVRLIGAELGLWEWEISFG